MVSTNIWTCPPVVNTDDRRSGRDCGHRQPLGFKGNYIIFPLKETCYLTTYMLQEFIDDTYGLKDPDIFARGRRWAPSTRSRRAWLRS